ncbi:MAG: flagellar biosynthesis protein FlhA [Treponemataceae bacterium]|nr:MAG: flagellar biosynthesis protein FlhA [Treponemataceae bacterium]
MAEKALFKFNIQELSAPLAVVFAVLMVIIPLPPLLLDFLMIVGLAASILVLLITVTSRKVTDFSQFPTVLLVLTIFTLGLNVSSTRMILSYGSKLNTTVGGAVVKAFSSFVIGIGGSQGLVIGFVIFIIITAVQIFVITKGAKRSAEVNARFMLDGMPMKMAELSSEYSQGAITDEELKNGKQELQLEVDLARAMDGASNFVSGSAKIGIFITVINLVGGIIIGMTINGENFATAMQTYPKFTIGDGLFSQIPSLFVSVATGLLVSRSASQRPLGEDVYKQFTQTSAPFLVSGAAIAILGILPRFPWFIMVPMGALLIFAGLRLQTLPKTGAAPGAEEQKKGKQTGAAAADAGQVPRLDPISLEIGFALIPLVDQAKGAELLERVTRIRREAAVDMGLIVPQVRIIDNMRLDPHEYCIKIKGVEVGRSKIRIGWYLCMNTTGRITEDIPGEKTIEPAFGLPALWITDENRDRAERAGYAVIDPPTIIATHLNQIIKTHAAEILGRQEVQRILDQIKKDYPAVVDGVLSIGNDSFTVGEIQKVMQGLLREQVSIRNNVTILETLADFAKITHDTGILVEKVRQALGRQICLQYIDENQTLHVVTVSQEFQKKLIDSRVKLMDGWGAALDPASHRAWISAVSATFAAMQDAGYQPMILCPEETRPLVRNSTEREMPGLVVLSVHEIPADIKVESAGEIRSE